MVDLGVGGRLPLSPTLTTCQVMFVSLELICLNLKHSIQGFCFIEEYVHTSLNAAFSIEKKHEVTGET